MTRRKPKNKVTADTRDFWSRLRLNTTEELRSREVSFVVHDMNPSSERREKLLKIIVERGLHINRKWCVQIHQDKDLQTLLKSGRIRQVREGFGRSRHTVLVVT